MSHSYCYAGCRNAKFSILKVDNLSVTMLSAVMASVITLKYKIVMYALAQ